MGWNFSVHLIRGGKHFSDITNDMHQSKLAIIPSKRRRRISKDTCNTNPKEKTDSDIIN
jgi:hypothetical protein